MEDIIQLRKKFILIAKKKIVFFISKIGIVELLVESTIDRTVCCRLGFEIQTRFFVVKLIKFVLFIIERKWHCISIHHLYNFNVGTQVFFASYETMRSRVIYQSLYINSICRPNGVAVSGGGVAEIDYYLHSGI